MPRSLIAFDLGLRNMGIAQLSIQQLHPSTAHVHVNQLIQYSVESRDSYDVLAYASEAHGLIHSLVQPERYPDAFLLEKQILATVESGLAGNTKLLSWEALLIGILHTQRQHKRLNFDVKSVGSTTVSRLFSLGPEHKLEDATVEEQKVLLKKMKKRKNKLLKKEKAVQLTQSFIKNQGPKPNVSKAQVTFSIAREAKGNWDKAKKKDDMADAFLLGLSSVYFELNRQAHRMELLKKLENGVLDGKDKN